MTLLIQGAYIERRSKASLRSRTDSKDVYYLVWEQPQDNAGLMLTCERRMWRQTFFELLEENRIKETHKAPFATKWVLNK